MTGETATMPLDKSVRRLVRFWEVRRIIFCVFAGCLAWWSYRLFSGIQAGLGYPQNGTTGGVWFRFGVLFVGLNVCFSFVYALEFLLRSWTFWATWGRHLVFMTGLLAGLWLAFAYGGQIGIYEFSFR